MLDTQPSQQPKQWNSPMHPRHMLHVCRGSAWIQQALQLGIILLGCLHSTRQLLMQSSKLLCCCFHQALQHHDLQLSQPPAGLHSSCSCSLLLCACSLLCCCIQQALQHPHLLLGSFQLVLQLFFIGYMSLPDHRLCL